MSPSLALPPSRPRPDNGRLFLTAAFFAFCYCLLTWRAQLLTDAAPLFSERRAIALLVGAGVFWLALGQLERPGRLTLTRTASWIVLGTVIVMIARLAVDRWHPDVLLTPSYSLVWSLAWAAYFGMWLIGAVLFRARSAAVTATAALPAISAPMRDVAEWDQIEWLVDALAPELEQASGDDRARLAERLIRTAGTYELVDESGVNAAHNARLRLATRLAARITAEPR